MPKKIMMLGGNYFQMTAVLAAKRLGYHVIDVDYLPGNPAHRYADEYYNISTIDKEKVLQKARESSPMHLTSPLRQRPTSPRPWGCPPIRTSRS